MMLKVKKEEEKVIIAATLAEPSPFGNPVNPLHGPLDKLVFISFSLCFSLFSPSRPLLLPPHSPVASLLPMHGMTLDRGSLTR